MNHPSGGAQSSEEAAEPMRRLWRGRLRALLGDSRVRYLCAGSTVFLVNLAAFRLLLAALPDTLLGHNLANVGATEVSYLYGYIVHSLFTWNTQRPSWRGLALFHAVSLAGFVLRAVTFAVMDHQGFPTMVSLVASIALQVISNFLGYERWVFKARSRWRRS